MSTPLRLPLFACLVVLVAAGCGSPNNPTDGGTGGGGGAMGGGGGSTGGGGGAHVFPIEDAGTPAPLTLTASPSALTVSPGDTVHLTAVGGGGRGSLGYSWARVSGPDVTPLPANAASTSFVAPDIAATADVVLRVTLRDGAGQSKTADVTVTVTVPPLTANAGSDLTVLSGQVIKLSGTATGGNGTYDFSWKAVGSNTKIAGAATAFATINAPVTTTAQTLTFELTVKSGAATPAKDTVVVTVAPPPTSTAISANAGTDVTVKAGAAVTLHGIGTGAGTVLYQWTQTGGTPAVTLFNPGTANPYFDVPEVTTMTDFTFTLTVTDGASATATDTVVVSALPIDPLVASAGVDVSAVVGTPVSLHATATGGVGPYFFNWGATHAMPQLTNGNTSNPSITLNTPGTFTYTVQVTDKGGLTAMDSVVVTMTAPPAARCWQCNGLNCLLTNALTDCASGQDACRTEVKDQDNLRSIARSCATRSAVTANPAGCENIQNALTSQLTCNFYCTGEACNAPPNLIPPNGYLTP